jgi:hypothetical protein
MTLLQFHVIVSLIGIVSGVIVAYGLVTGRPLPAWTALFLVTTILTSATGFPLAPFGFDPPRALGIISLVLLALAVLALYPLRLAGPWRWIYVVTATAALYFNVFVGIVQAFGKLPPLQALAPTPDRSAVRRRATRRAGRLHCDRLVGGAHVPAGACGEILTRGTQPTSLGFDDTSSAFTITHDILGTGGALPRQHD